MLTEKDKFQRREQRVRTKIARVSGGRPRLTVFRSNKYIYAQIVDDSKRATIVAASSIEKEFGGKGKIALCDTKAAEAIGKLLAERAQKAGIKEVVFDRGAYLYHGRVKALAEGARAAGLSF